MLLRNESPSNDSVVLSVVVPAFNEELNLPQLHDQLKSTLDPLGLSWEMIVVDDHSGDATFEVAMRLRAEDPRVSAVRLARNGGSHMASLCGLLRARGQCASLIAADLQDPPDVIPRMLDRWREGAQVVWAVREAREARNLSDRLTSYLYNRMMARMLHRPDISSGGADLFLVDRRVIQALENFRENNLSLFATLQWLGFRQSTLLYRKQQRLHGQSGWTLRKKLKLVVDSITAFSYFPIRLMSVVGSAVALGGFAYAVFLVVNALLGTPPEGWTSLMVALLVVSGIQMAMLGVLGEYLWRSLDEARGRPRFVIERTTGEGESVCS